MLDRLGASPRSRFFTACAVGGALAMVVFAWFLLGGRADLFGREFFSNFYEAQARSLLHGHWDVPANSLSFERFEIDGKYFTYFGPWPALLRLPFVAFTDDLDGKLTRVSMLIAFALMLVAIARMSWQARTILRGDGMPTRRALVAAGAFVFVASCGSTALFLGNRAWVYHEAILWGLAWALLSYSFLVSYLFEPSRRNVVLAGATATLAVLSRATVGAGPVVALGIVLVARLALVARERWQRRRDKTTAMPSAPWLRWLGLGDPSRNRSILPLAVATAVPIALYAYVNYAKFGSLFGLPLEHQDRLVAAPQLQAALDANRGGLLGAKYVPTTLLQYFRPDAIDFDRLFPWITFSGRPRVVGDVVFVSISDSASFTASATCLFVLAVVGVVAVLRRVRRDGADDTDQSAAVFRVPLVAALAAGLATAAIAYLEQRYEADFLPLFLIAGAVGLWWLPRLLEARGRVLRVAAATVVVALGVWSVWATASLTLLQQRAYGPFVTDTTLARLVDVQLAVHGDIPGGAPSRVDHADTLPLPAPAEAASLFVVGDCDGLYWSSGRAWLPVEETPSTGRFRLRVRIADAPKGTRAPLVASESEAGASILWLQHLAGDKVRFEYEWTGEPSRRPTVGDAMRIPYDRPVNLAVRLDPVFGFIEVRGLGQGLFSDFAPVAQAPAVVGRQGTSQRGTSRFSGTIRSQATQTPVCDRLARLERE